MFFGLAPTNGNLFAGSYSAFNNIYRMDMKNGKFDEIKIDAADLPYNTSKQEWDFYTLAIGRFENDKLEFGNIENKGMPIQYIRFKRRKIDDLTWTNIKDIPFDKNVELYELEDNYVKAHQEYEYGISPVIENLEGQINSKQIEAIFDDLFLIGKDNKTYKVHYDLELGDIEYVRETSMTTTLGSQYPYFQSSNVKYRKGSIKNTMISDKSIEIYGISDKDEIKNKENILNFLDDGKTKLLKNGSGIFYLVRLTDVRETPFNQLQQRISGVSFTFTEIGNAESLQELILNGLVY